MLKFNLAKTEWAALIVSHLSGVWTDGPAAKMVHRAVSSYIWPPESRCLSLYLRYILTPGFRCVKRCAVLLRLHMIDVRATQTSVLYVYRACMQNNAFQVPSQVLTKFGRRLCKSPTFSIRLLRYSIDWSTKVESKDQFDLINNFDCLFMHCIDLRITPVSYMFDVQICWRCDGESPFMISSPKSKENWPLFICLFFWVQCNP